MTTLWAAPGEGRRSSFGFRLPPLARAWAHDAQEILEWAGGKRLYSLTAIPSECIIEVVKAEEE